MLRGSGWRITGKDSALSYQLKKAGTDLFALFTLCSNARIYTQPVRNHHGHAVMKLPGNPDYPID
jgi:hypothetical protein